MDKNAIKKYAVWARRDLIERVAKKAQQFGIEKQNIVDAKADTINDKILTASEKRQRQALIARIKEKEKDGYEQVMEEVAYTWFNRFSALRFMEVNGYLPTHVRVFTDDENNFKPQILAEAIHLDMDGLDMEKVYVFKDANKTDELYKYLLITQCNALSSILPGMFQKIEDYTELLFPDNLLRQGSVIEQMVTLIPETDWKDAVQIIGWLYQYYNDEKKNQVINIYKGTVKKEDIPAATQLFTTDWIVRYVVDNSVGRYWIERNPSSDLKNKLKYYVESKNEESVFIDEMITPEQLTVIDPCMGSAHFSVYAFEVLMKIYTECGYTEREATVAIVENNIYGLDICKRATQLAYFAIMMKACQYDRRFLRRGIQPNMYVIQDGNGFDSHMMEYFCNGDTNLQETMRILIDELHDAVEYGSMIELSSIDFESLYIRFEEIQDDIHIQREIALNKLLPFVQAADVLAKKYCVVVTNPPYLNKYEEKIKDFIYEKYRDFSGDLFSVFMYRNFKFCVNGGYVGFMTPFVWMFIKAHEKLRAYLLKNKTVVTLVQMEYSAYEEATVPICTFVCKNERPCCKGLYFRLSDFRGGMDIQGQKVREGIHSSSCTYLYETEQQNFFNIPGYPVAYWAGEKLFWAFEAFEKVEKYFDVRNGITTGDNNLFLKLWFEIKTPSQRWFSCNKGGSFRKWSGNREYVVDWEDDGYRLKTFVNSDGKLRATLRGIDFNFTAGITMSRITSGTPSFREMRSDSISESATNGIYPKNSKREDSLGLMALLNSKIGEHILSLLNPTINVVPEDIRSIPIDISVLRTNAFLASENVSISSTDWDNFEISRDFIRHPLLPLYNYDCDGISKSFCIKQIFLTWQNDCDIRFEKLKLNEETLNKAFINGYGLQNKLISKVSDEDVTVRKADLLRDTKSLISYAVGCMVGRYSLDIEGLVYAGGEWDESKYFTYPADKDNIIPICDDEYFEDDIAGRFIKFIKVVYGENTLQENLKFIADALDGKGQPKEVIRNYFLNNFYKDHCKMYQKRPIYWLFDSGKKNGFKCLIYMHRYEPDTIARIRTDYVHEQQSRYRTAIEDLEQQIMNASTSERVKLNKKLLNLQAQATETREYEEKIHHLADQMIRIDLDDGVKKNYEKFKDVLAKIN